MVVRQLVDQHFVDRHHRGANPTIASYNAGAVKFYNGTSSPVRFENNIFLLYFKKRPSLLQRWRCSCKFRSRRIGTRMLLHPFVLHMAVKIQIADSKTAHIGKPNRTHPMLQWPAVSCQSESTP
jgi:hypothetical protein